MSLNTATFIPGHEEWERQLLNKGKRLIKGGQAERGNSKGVMQGGKRGRGLRLKAEVEVEVGTGVGVEKPP